MNSLGGKEPETRANVCRLRREESIEDVRGYFGRHSRTGVGYGDDYIGPWDGSGMFAGKLLIDHQVCRADP